MTPWKCCGCGCEYAWSDPHIKDGSDFCDVCIVYADDPDVAVDIFVSNPPVNNPPVVEKEPPKLGCWWFAIGIAVGIVLAKWLY